MMYQSQKLSPEEIKRKKHRMQTMQMSRDSDLKRAKNKQNAAAADVHRLKTEIMRFQSELKEREQEFKKLRTEEEFLTDELRHIKKVLMNLK